MCRMIRLTVFTYGELALHTIQVFVLIVLQAVPTLVSIHVWGVVVDVVQKLIVRFKHVEGSGPHDPALFHTRKTNLTLMRDQESL